MVIGRLQFDAGQTFNGTNVGQLVFLAERHGNTFSAGTGGSSNPVHVGLGLVGNLEIDHVGDVIHVDAASDDVRRHQDLDSACIEIAQSSLTSALALVGVDGVCTDPTLHQIARDPVGPVFGAGEDDGTIDALFFQHLSQQGTFVRLFYE